MSWASAAGIARHWSESLINAIESSVRDMRTPENLEKAAKRKEAAAEYQRACDHYTRAADAYATGNKEKGERYDQEAHDTFSKAWEIEQKIK